MERTKRVTVKLNVEQHKKIKIICVQLGLTLSNFFSTSAFEKIDKLESEKQIPTAN